MFVLIGFSIDQTCFYLSIMMRDKDPLKTLNWKAFDHIIKNMSLYLMRI